MISKAIICILIIINFFIVNVYAQLSGTYNIGGTNPDYNTILSAVNDLKLKGASGSIIFDIYPGTYSGFSIGAISGLNNMDTLVIKSATNNSTDVIIKELNETVQLLGAIFVTLKHLTIESSGSTYTNAVIFDKVYYCSIQNCIIKTPNSPGTSADDHSSIRVKHRWDPPRTTVSIINNQFIGSGSGIKVEIYKGRTLIDGNNFATTGKYAVYCERVEELTMKNNYLNGELYFQWTTGPLFTNNTIENDIEISGFALIKQNIFRSKFLSRGARQIFENTFEQNVTLRYSNNTAFNNNVCLGDVKFLYCNYSTLSKNIFYKKVEVGMCDQVKLFNNIFHDLLDTGVAYWPEIHYNNFGPNGFLNGHFFSIIATNNNFSQDPYFGHGSIIKYNNYYPHGGNYDEHPFFINPQYIDSIELKAQNTLLIGKALPVSYIQTDKDEFTRNYLPTIGAHELCINSFNEIDSIEIQCGNSVALKVCSPSTSFYCWTPAYGLNDSLSLSPIATPKLNTKYYQLDTLGNIIDSVYVIVKNFYVEQINDKSIDCGYSIYIGGNFNPDALYTWMPAYGLSDTTIYNPIASPEITTNYIQKIFIPGCGLFYDTMMVEVDSRARAYASKTINLDTVWFYNYSVCADSFVWIFGDDNTSFEKEPIHVYQSGGEFHVYCIAFNSFSSDTFELYVNIYSTEIDKLNKFSEIDIYPNPADKYINMSYHSFFNQICIIQLYDISGKKIFEQEYFSKNGKNIFMVDIQDLRSGLYFIKVESEKNNKTLKFIKS
jgi:hypothetical protein